MKWSKTIELSGPLADVRLLKGAPTQDWEALMRQREEAAHARGRREGESALNAQLIQQRTEIVELQRGILQSLRAAIPQVVQESETAVIELALEAAGRIVAGLPIDSQMVGAVVREALSQTKETAEILVQLHPADLALIQKHGGGEVEGEPDGAPLRFAASNEVSRGGCVLQTRFGVIDARREVKLEQLRQSVAS